jgi:hypothetical protein
MKWIEVYGDTVGRNFCRDVACEAPLIWAEVVKTGRKMCFNGDAVPVQTRHDEAGRLIEIYDVADNHWAVCPGAKSFKRAR